MLGVTFWVKAYSTCGFCEYSSSLTVQFQVVSQEGVNVNQPSESGFSQCECFLGISALWINSGGLKITSGPTRSDMADLSGRAVLWFHRLVLSIQNPSHHCLSPLQSPWSLIHNPKKHLCELQIVWTTRGLKGTTNRADFKTTNQLQIPFIWLLSLSQNKSRRGFNLMTDADQLCFDRWSVCFFLSRFITQQTKQWTNQLASGELVWWHVSEGELSKH